MSEMVRIRRFSEAGLAVVKSVLQEIRETNNIQAEKVKSILLDPLYTSHIGEVIEIDLAAKFSQKKDVIDTLMPKFDDAFLSKYRQDRGLWTWLAMAYHTQFMKTKRSILSVATDYCWIYDPEMYRFSRRHFIAGTIYLYKDFEGACDQAKEILFSGEPWLFSGFLDAITYKEEGFRLPALLQVAAWLYYDPNASKKIKYGSTSQDKPGALRELIRVIAQFAMTYDYSSKEDASKLWNRLPEQFKKFKGNSVH